MKPFSLCFSITINSILDAGESLVWFTTLNLKSGYWQVEVDGGGEGGKLSQQDKDCGNLKRWGLASAIHQLHLKV